MPAMIHAKLMTIDGLWSVVGSTNFDHQSFALNDEVNLAVRDRELAGVIDADLAEDLKVSRRLSEDSLRGRGVPALLDEVVGHAMRFESRRRNRVPALLGFLLGCRFGFGRGLFVDDALGAAAATAYNFSARFLALVHNGEGVAGDTLGIEFFGNFGFQVFAGLGLGEGTDRQATENRERDQWFHWEPPGLLELWFWAGQIIARSRRRAVIAVEGWGSADTIWVGERNVSDGGDAGKLGADPVCGVGVRGGGRAGGGRAVERRCGRAGGDTGAARVFAGVAVAAGVGVCAMDAAALRGGAGGYGAGAGADADPDRRGGGHGGAGVMGGREKQGVGTGDLGLRARQ